MKIEIGMYPFTPFELRLFHSRKKCSDWVMRKYGTELEYKDGCGAQTVLIDDVAVVLIEVSEEAVWENALLVHESYHIVCEHLKAIGEENAGEEIMAYMIQCVSGALMDAHMRWRSRHAIGNDE